MRAERNPPVVTVSMLGSLSSRPFTELTVTWYVLPGTMLASSASNTPPSTVTVIGLPVEGGQLTVSFERVFFWGGGEVCYLLQRARR